MLLDVVIVALLDMGIDILYEWAHPETVALDQILQHKSPFLNTPFFIVRTVLYRNNFV